MYGFCCIGLIGELGGPRLFLGLCEGLGLGELGGCPNDEVAGG